MIRRLVRWVTPVIKALLLLGVASPTFTSSHEGECPPNDARQVPQRHQAEHQAPEYNVKGTWSHLLGLNDGRMSCSMHVPNELGPVRYGAVRIGTRERYMAIGPRQVCLPVSRGKWDEL
jgi:hypothetical protein